MIPCIIESPFAGDLERNERYLRACERWCIANGFTPYASHRQLTRALDDANPEERRIGMEAGWHMAISMLRAIPEAVVFFFEDLHVSGGMKSALALYEQEGLSHRVQRIKIYTEYPENITL